MSHAPWRAFSAQIKAIIRDSSALWANCSCLTLSGTPSALASSLPTLSMRFWRASILESVLSRKGAEKETLSAPWPPSLMSSLRGLFGPASPFAAAEAAPAPAPARCALGFVLHVVSCLRARLRVEEVGHALLDDAHVLRHLSQATSNARHEDLVGGRLWHCRTSGAGSATDLI